MRPKERNLKLGVYSFYDREAKMYDTPFFCESDLFANRHYKMVTEKEGALVNRFREDFDLIKLGEFDVIDGRFIDIGKSTLIYGNKIKGGNKDEISYGA